MFAWALVVDKCVSLDFSEFREFSNFFQASFTCSTNMSLMGDKLKGIPSVTTIYFGDITASPKGDVGNAILDTKGKRVFLVFSVCYKQIGVS